MPQLHASSNLKLIGALHHATATRAGCNFFVTHDKDINAMQSGGGMEVIRLAELVD